LQFAEYEICSVVENVWSSVLGLEIIPAWGVRQNGEEDDLCGTVKIVESHWRGVVSLACPLPLAKKAASVMFDQIERDINLDQIEDALGELTNITGGNIKLLLPELSTLMLPEVYSQQDVNAPFQNGRLISRVHFESEGQPLVVAIHQTGENSGGTDVA